MKIYIQIVPNDDGTPRLDITPHMSTRGWRLVNVLEIPDVHEQVLAETQRAFENNKGGK